MPHPISSSYVPPALMSSKAHRSMTEGCVSCGGRRLHSLSLPFMARVVAGLLAVGTYPLVAATAELAPRLSVVPWVDAGGVLSTMLVSVIGLLRWGPQVRATRAGLEIAQGNQWRIVPWDEIFDIRERPWLFLASPSDLKLWRVDFMRGKSFTFIGVRQARTIVQAFWDAYRTK